jgi:hypothetical protein
MVGCVHYFTLCEGVTRWFLLSYVVSALRHQEPLSPSPSIRVCVCTRSGGNDGDLRSKTRTIEGPIRTVADGTTSRQHNNFIKKQQQNNQQWQRNKEKE